MSPQKQNFCPMDPKDQDPKIDVTPEEAEAEQDAIKGATTTDEELRDKLAEEYGIDPDTEADLLDKLVKREKSHREKLSGAIKQKIKYRDSLKGKQTPAGTPPAGEPPKKAEALSEEAVDRKVNERLEQRDLEELNLPEDIEKEVKDLAKLKGISVRKAAQLPYITSLKKEHEEAERLKSATPTRKGKGSYASSYDPSKGAPDPADFQLDTPEGQKAWREAKEARRAHETKK
jgi:hypothetical protein